MKYSKKHRKVSRFVDISYNYQESITDKIEKYIAENLNKKEIIIAEMATELNFSTYMLRQEIKKQTNLSVVNYILKLRLHIAKNLMVFKHLKAKQAACETGFCSYSYFNKCFKKEFGFLPSKL